MEPILERLELPWRIINANEAPDVTFTLVASRTDAQLVEMRGGRYLYVEHGAGQTYEPFHHPAYSGGHGHGTSLGFICPGQDVAYRWRLRYPHITAWPVGCPKLDPWHSGERPIPTDMTVAITFHFDCNVSKFSRWAFPHYRRELPKVVDAWRRQGWIVVGHAHPKAVGVLERFWGDIGVEYLPLLSDVFDRANILVADNTSALPEFMSLGRPVVFLNAPWYNKDKAVGGRFWDWTGAGPMVDTPDELAAVDLDFLAIADPYRVGREAVVKRIYHACDGQASHRAAKAVAHVYERTS